MKLAEIVNQSYEGSPGDITQLTTHPNRRKESTIEGKQVWFTHVNETLQCYDLEGLAVVTGRMFSSSSIPNGFRISVVLVAPESRGKGLATLLYKYLLDHKGYTIVSDSHMSDGALSVWKGLVKLHYSVTKIDLGNGGQIEITNPDDVIKAVDGRWNTALMAKNTLTEAGIPYVGEGILTPRMTISESGEFY